MLNGLFTLNYIQIIWIIHIILGEALTKALDGGLF
jgi:hypothetical protein